MAAAGTEQLFALKSNFIKPLHKKGVQVFLIIDACRSPIQDSTLKALKGFNPDLDQNTAEINAGDITLLATTNGHPSIETSNNNIKHGVFTYYLLNGLYGMANDTARPNSLITLSELSNYINFWVSQYSRGKQVPKMVDNGEDDPCISIVDSNLLADAKKKFAGQMSQQYAYVPNTNKDFKIVATSDMGNAPEYKAFRESLKKGDLFGEQGALSWFSKIETQTHDTDFLQNTALDLMSVMSYSGQAKVNAYFSNDRNFFSKINITPYFKHGITLYDDLYALAQKYFPDTLENKKNYLRLAYFMRGKTLAYSYSSSDQKEALDYLKKAYSLDTNSLFILNAMNQVLANEQQYSEALLNEKKVVEKYPNWPYALILEGTIYQNLKQYNKAIEYYKKTIKIDSSNTSYAWYNLGIAYTSIKNYDSAIYCYKKDIKIDSGFSSAWYGLGNVNRELKKYDSAVACYIKALEIYPFFTDAWAGLGAVKQDLKYFKTAIYCYREAIFIDSNYTYGWYNLGSAYLNLKNYDSSGFCYRKVLQIDSDYTEALSGLGTVYLGTKEYDYANYYYKKAIQRDPDCVTAWNGLGAVQQGLTNYNAAIPYYRKSISINPNYLYGLFNLGTIYNAVAKYDSAIFIFRKAIQSDPDYIPNWTGLGRVYYDQKKYDSAVICYKEAITIDPNDSAGWVDLGSAYRGLNEYNMAIYCCKKSLQVNSNYAIAWENIGFDYSKTQKYDSALFCYQTAMNISGSDKEWIGSHIYVLLKYDALGSPTLWYNLSMDYKKYGLSSDSIVRFLNYSIQIDSAGSHYDAWPELCQALKQKTFDQIAINYLERKRAAGDQSFLIQYNLARCYYEATNYEKATALLKSAYGGEPVEKIDRQDFPDIPEAQWEKLTK